MSSDSENGGPGPVSVILTTRDRPRFLAVALACYKHQTFANRELIVVDDGDLFPADPDIVSAVGGRLIRMPPGTPLGTKLNQGIQESTGLLCQKVDDDDWYAPQFLETMVSAHRKSQQLVCRPVVAFLMPFLFFEVAKWEIRRSEHGNAPGATLMFTRKQWKERPFRGLFRDEDVWFFIDQARRGATLLPVRGLETFLAIRHSGLASDRAHAWTHQFDGTTLEQHLQVRPLHDRQPEEMLPEWALDVYRAIRQEILTTSD